MTQTDPEQFVPGAWRCPKCSFRLTQCHLNSKDGTVTDRDDPGEKCPNCYGPLWRVTWMDEANENLALAENQLERALTAERRVAELETVLLPFSISGGLVLPDALPDSTVIGVRADDLRRARAVYRRDPVPEEEKKPVAPSMRTVLKRLFKRKKP